MNLPARGRAAGKIILLGEHAVVYGRPALAAGLPIGLEAEVGPGTGALRFESDRPELAADPRPAMTAERAAILVGAPPDGLVVRVRSAIPPGAGLGSSAALAVAVLRALAAAAGRTLGRDEELAFGRDLEAPFHGRPSGIDPAAAALGGCLRFVRGEPPVVVPLRTPGALPLVIALGGGRRSTGAAVEALRVRWERDRDRHERLFDEIAAVVGEGAGALEGGDLPALGRAFDRNQELLRALGVSTPGTEEVVALARRAGALGAKLTGAGEGGAVIALAPETDRVAAAIAGAGARAVVVHVGGMAEAA